MHSQQGVNFTVAFNSLLADSLTNNHKDNYDAERFGQFGIKGVLEDRLKGLIAGRFLESSRLQSRLRAMQPYFERLQRVYDLLEDKASKDLLVQIIGYRVLGPRKVKLPTNNDNYWVVLDELKRSTSGKPTIDPHFMHFKLSKFDLRPFGHDLDIYLTPVGVILDFINEQYRYDSGGMDIGAADGDTVLDLGGCYGDTALYFAERVGSDGHVYSFEFIPNNLSIMDTNLDLNPELKSRVSVVPNPVWKEQGKTVYFKDNGPGSVVSFEKLKDTDQITSTISVDDFVAATAPKSVDFIKMDIEGAELPALSGSVDTIRKFHPTLAIAIYHSMDDFVGIPEFIHSLDLGYKFYLKHTTIHTEESVLFCV